MPEEITLALLAREHIERLIADTLRCTPENAVPLAQLVHKKTSGNPLFAIQFLSSLAEEGMLNFDHDAGHWNWPLERIQAKGYTDNVADLMVGALTGLPGETLQAVQQLACLGDSAEASILSRLLGISPDQLDVTLWEAVRQGLVDRLPGTYKFAHNRVQEAAYSLIPGPTRPALHLRIGRLLVACTPRERHGEAIFEIVDQLNRAIAVIASSEEREELAALDLLAGRRAKASIAYASALKYFTIATSLLGKDAWQRGPTLLLRSK